MQFDNARLVKLIGSTNEYREFASFSDDSGGLAYVPPGAGKMPDLQYPLDLARTEGCDGHALTQHLPTSERAVKGAAHEADYWVPSDAYALANNFRRDHIPNLPMEIFADLLLRLNRIWRLREGKRLERNRAKAAKKVSELRRQAKQTAPYEDVISVNEVLVRTY